MFVITDFHKHSILCSCSLFESTLVVSCFRILNFVLTKWCGELDLRLSLNWDKFNGENEFNLWRIKMKAMLVHHGLYAALSKEEFRKKEMEKLLSLKTFLPKPPVL